MTTLGTLQSELEGAEPKRVRTLVVDDVEDVREGLARLLRHVPGIDVGTAVDGEDALVQAASLAPGRGPSWACACRSSTGSLPPARYRDRHPEVAAVTHARPTATSRQLSRRCSVALVDTLSHRASEIAYPRRRSWWRANGESRLSGAVTKPLLERLVDALGAERGLRQAAEASQRMLAIREAEARKLAARLASLIDAAPVAVIETDQSVRIKLLEPRRRATLRLDAGRTSRPSGPNKSPDGEPASQERIETRHLQRNGNPVDVELVIATVPGDSEHQPSRIKIILDVTDRQRLKGRAAPPGIPRPAHGVAEPLAIRGSAFPSAGARWSRLVAARAPSAGPRRIQGCQRQLGHDVGDEVLISSAHVLASSLRPEDTIARLGGDEFVVLVEGAADDFDAAVVAERMLAALRAPLTVNGRSLSIRASVGIAEAHGSPTEDAATLLRDADLAMYAAKHPGKGQWTRFEPEMRAAQLERVRMRQTEPRWRPISWKCTTSPYSGPNLRETAVGRSALLRWSHPARGYLLPLAFIGVVEEIGLMPHSGSGASAPPALKWSAGTASSRITPTSG